MPIKKNTKPDQDSHQEQSASEMTDKKATAGKNGEKKNQAENTEFILSINLNKLFGRGLIYIVGAILFVFLFLSYFTSRPKDEIPLSSLLTDIKEEKVAKLEIAASRINATYKDKSEKFALNEEQQSTIEVLEAADIDPTSLEIDVTDVSWMESIVPLLFNVLMLVMFVGFFVFLYRQTRGTQDGLLGIGRSKAKVFVKGKQDVKFRDVGGMDEAKKELEEVVDFLKNPKKYTKVGARTPKGVLLVGPAGTGKTLLARAVAGEANVQFLSIAGSEFMEMLVGVGASRVRDLFLTAKKIAPSIIFIDEIDAIGRMRGHGSMGGHDEREQTLNQILVEMDGFSQNDNVIVMAATNRGDMLDPALVRPGRFDRRVMVNLPDLEERKFILSIHARKKPFSPTVNWEWVAKRTVGFSGADLENMLNEAAIAVARENRDAITMEDIEEASLKVKLGPSKKRLQDEIERKMTAYHEAGHAVIAHVSPHSDPVHRISIVSRGRALGFTLTPPERDRLQVTKSELVDEIAVLLGGRAAEEMIFGELTAGASNDIERATAIARAMVMDYGMSELGPMNFSPQYEGSNYSRAWGEPLKISDRLQEQVDVKVREFIDEGKKKAAQLLKKHKKELDVVSNRLLEIETLDAEEFEKLMGMPKAKKNGTLIEQ
jgi:cell division protease FtsH